MLAISLHRDFAQENVPFYMHSKDINIIIGRNLKRLRINAGLTQDGLGDLLGIDGVSIAHIEGAIRGMGKDLMSRLCDVLNVRPYEFYLEEEEPIPVKRSEKELLYKIREAESLQLGEDIVSYIDYRLRRKKE